jgi:hypothetical protein
MPVPSAAAAPWGAAVGTATATRATAAGAAAAAVALLLLAPSGAHAQELVTLDKFRSSYKIEHAYNIWGAVKPGPGLTGGWADPAAISDWECFAGVPAFDKCTIAPTYSVADVDPSSEAAAVGYLADPGNWASGTLQVGREGREARGLWSFGAGGGWVFRYGSSSSGVFSRS